MASIEEEVEKRYRLMKSLNPWGAIDYLEAQIAQRDQRIAELERELESWPIEYEFVITQPD